MISTKYFDHRSLEVRTALDSQSVPADAARDAVHASFLLSFWRKTGYLCRGARGGFVSAESILYL